MIEPLPLLVAAALPFLAVAATAFARIAVVLGLLRGGLGLPAALPAPVIWGFAAVLAAAVMSPVAVEIGDALPQGPIDPALLAERGWPILERFLVTHTPPETAGAVFEALGGAATPPARVVAFLVSELDAAFRLGLWLLAPFLVVDLLAAHALLALGFDRLRPAAVALPLKLALFVAADGWMLLVGRLAGGYAS